MENLKFRAWTGGDFIYWEEHHGSNFFWDKVNCLDLDADLFCNLDDKNGRNLNWWVGDVLQDEDGGRGEIVFEDGAFRLKRKDWPEDMRYMSLGTPSNREHLVQVGTIYTIDL